MSIVYVSVTNLEGYIMYINTDNLIKAYSNHTASTQDLFLYASMMGKNERKKFVGQAKKIILVKS